MKRPNTAVQGAPSGQRLAFVDLMCEFHLAAEVLCPFCSITSCSTKIGQTFEQSN